MVTTLQNYLDSRYRAQVTEAYDGVVRVAIGGYYGSGVLLYDGQAILTAAHLFEGLSETIANVYFETPQGDFTLKSTSTLTHPSYDPINGNNDLALVWLVSDIPIYAKRYTLYRQSDEVSKTFQMIGYGIPGDGSTGSLDSYNEAYIRLMTHNSFDAEASVLKTSLGNTMAWTPTKNSQLLADFDDGTVAKDALGQFLGVYDTGEGDMEGIISSGDSGGPALIDEKIAGIASYVTSLSTSYYHPDSDSEANSTFGEIAAWQRVSYYQEWIDTALRTHYSDTPTKASEVQKSFQEGQSGITSAYFLVEFLGVRKNIDTWVSVDYTTRDGSALEGEDYVGTSGTLVLYPNENHAVIHVEIIADTIKESDETFFLDIFNPIGGTFGEGVVTLSAMRTILNDDLF